MPIEEMSEEGILRARLQWVQHDLDHVVAERDKIQEKLDFIFFITGEVRRGESTAEQAIIQVRSLSRS